MGRKKLEVIQVLSIDFVKLQSHQFLESFAVEPLHTKMIKISKMYNAGLVKYHSDGYILTAKGIAMFCKNDLNTQFTAAYDILKNFDIIMLKAFIKKHRDLLNPQIAEEIQLLAHEEEVKSLRIQEKEDVAQKESERAERIASKANSLYLKYKDILNKKIRYIVRSLYRRDAQLKDDDILKNKLVKKLNFDDQSSMVRWLIENWPQQLHKNFGDSAAMKKLMEKM